jgi:tetratricopeptide (TPR) repeat protein
VNGSWFIIKPPTIPIAKQDNRKSKIDEYNKDFQQMVFTAEALNKQGSYQQVLDLLLPTAEHPDNQNASFFNELGIAYGKIGSKNNDISFWAEAYQYHCKAYELDSTEPMYMFNLAVAASWLDKKDEALLLFKKYLATGHKKERKLALDMVNELESLSYCAECGSDIDEDDRFCGKCGARLIKK